MKKILLLIVILFSTTACQTNTIIACQSLRPPYLEVRSLKHNQTFRTWHSLVYKSSSDQDWKELLNNVEVDPTKKACDTLKVWDRDQIYWIDFAGYIFSSKDFGRTWTPQLKN